MTGHDESPRSLHRVLFYLAVGLVVLSGCVLVLALVADSQGDRAPVDSPPGGAAGTGVAGDPMSAGHPADAAPARLHLVGLDLLASDAGTGRFIQEVRWTCVLSDGQRRGPYLAGEAGWTHVPGLEAGSRVVLRAAAPGYAEAEVAITVGSPHPPVTVEMRGRATVSGLVRDARSLQPLPGARVSALLGQDLIETVTSSTGAFQLGPLPAVGQCRVACELHGYAPQSKTCVLNAPTSPEQATADTVLHMDMAVLDLVTVTVELGQPGPDAPSLRLPIAVLDGSQLVFSGRVEVARGIGRVEVAASAALKLTGRIAAQTGEPLEAQGEVMKIGSDRACLLRFAAPTLLAVRAFAAGKPLVGQLLACSSGEECVTAVTDGQGVAWWPPFRTAETRIVFWSPAAGVSPEIECAVLHASRGPMDIHLGDHGGRILVVRNGHEGKGIEVQRGLRSELAYAQRETETGPQFLVPAGSYAVTLHRAAVPGVRGRVEVGGDLVLALGSSSDRGGIRGRTDPKATLRLHRVLAMEQQLLDSVVASDDGLFQFQRVAPGDYLVTATIDKQAFVRRTLTVTAGQCVDIGLLDVSELQKLTLRLLDASGHVCAHRQLRITGLPTWLHEELELTTDETGRFWVTTPPTKQLHIATEGWFCILDAPGAGAETTLQVPLEHAHGNIVLPASMSAAGEVVWLTTRQGVRWGCLLPLKAGGLAPRPVAHGMQRLVVPAQGAFRLLEFDASDIDPATPAREAEERSYTVGLPRDGARWYVYVERWGDWDLSLLKWRYPVTPSSAGSLALRIPADAQLRIEAWVGERRIGAQHVRQ